MADQVTVFRSADPSAEDDANQVVEMLAREGIVAKLLDDSAPDVPEGAWEVQVSQADAARAEALVNANPQAESGDQSHDLDMVTVFTSADGSTEGFEAVAVKNLLEANGVEAMVANDSPLASLSQEVRVAREHVTRAKRLIADAIAAGPAAAEEAERETE
jgi:hypothetical protein